MQKCNLLHKYCHVVANSDFYFHGRQKEEFRRIITLLFSIQWKWMVTRPQAQYAPFKHQKHSPWDSCTINDCSKYCSPITVTVWKITMFSFSVSQKKKHKKVTKSKYFCSLSLQGCESPDENVPHYFSPLSPSALLTGEWFCYNTNGVLTILFI